MSGLESIIAGFFVIGLAELGDKTQLAVLALSTRYQARGVFVGVMLAFLLTDGLAVAVGGLATQVVSPGTLKEVSGVLFIVIGGYLLLPRKEGRERHMTKRRGGFLPALSTSFLVVAAMEMGDKTQIAAALLATQYHPLWVLVGALAALALISLGAMCLGKTLVKRVPEKTINRLAAALFILLGATALLY